MASDRTRTFVQRNVHTLARFLRSGVIDQAQHGPDRRFGAQYRAADMSLRSIDFQPKAKSAVGDGYQAHLAGLRQSAGAAITALGGEGSEMTPLSRPAVRGKAFENGRDSRGPVVRRSTRRSRRVSYDRPCGTGRPLQSSVAGYIGQCHLTTDQKVGISKSSRLQATAA